MGKVLKNYYEILGIPRSANNEQIKTAYRKLILKFHPDQNVGDSYFEEWSKKVIEAYEVLSDPQIRAEYDYTYEQTKLSSTPKAPAYADPPQQTDPVPPVYEEFISPDYPAGEPAEEGGMKQQVEEPISQSGDTQVDTGVPDSGSETKWNVYIDSDETGEEVEVEDIENVEPEDMESEETAVPVIQQQEAAVNEIERSFPAYLQAKQRLKQAQERYENIKAKPLPQKSNSQTLVLLVLGLVALAALGGLIYNFMNRPKPEPEVFEEKIQQEFRVLSDRAYFYEKPSAETRRRDFLSKGNEFFATKKFGKFYYTVYQSRINKQLIIRGWINENDVITSDKKSSEIVGDSSSSLPVQ